MFWCVLGERGTGKSVFVENRIKEIDNHALYIATLPVWDMYQDVIQRHQQRRPSTWECIELIDMLPDQIFTYPFLNYRNVVLDNLSYFVLYQICTNRDVFLCEFYNRLLSLIGKIAVNKNTTVHLIDTPLRQQDLLEKNEREMIFFFFFAIFHKAEKIERYYKGDILHQITEEEGKNYFFHI